MVLLKTYLEIYHLLRSLVYLITFPLSVVRYVIEHLSKKLWIAILSVGWFQMLQCPRFGTNLFSRAGRIALTNSNVHLFFGGVLSGVAILFFLYQPILRQFDGKYYVVFQRDAAAVAYAEESVASPSASAIAEIIVETATPIVTEIAPTPAPVVLPQRSAFIPPQSLPTGFVPPDVQNSGSYFSPLRNPPRLMISTRYRSGHPGIDLATEYGTPIYSVANGYVESVGSTIWAYGNIVYINHGDGVVSLYAHMSKVQVTPGQQVTKDTVIGAVGSTGNSSGPHLHLELHKNGQPFNPQSVLQGL